MERWFLILVAAFFVWTSSAHADTKVVVRSFSGPGNASVRRAVVKQLQGMKGIKVVDEAKAERVAKRRSVSLTGAARDEVARELGIAAWVEGRIKKKGGKVHATISVVDASSGDEAGAWSFARKKPKQLEQAVKQQFKKELKDSFANVSAPAGAEEEKSDEPAGETLDESAYEAPVAEETPEPAPTPVAQARDEESAFGSFTPTTDEQRVDGDEAEKKRGKNALVARVGAGMLHRSLKYNQAFTQNIGDYTLPAAPLADVGLRIYPAAFFTDSWASYIGLDLHGQFGFGLASEASDGTRYDTSYLEYDASLIGRYPLGPHELHASMGYGIQKFGMEDKGDVDAPVPDVDYRGLRFGMGGRYEVLPGYGFGLDGAFLMLTSLGELESQDWFPNASGSGIEAQLYFDAVIWKSLSARLHGSYQRQFFDFNSEEGDQRIAGGAVDQYLVAGLSASYTY